MKKIMLAALAGTIVTFLWSTISYIALPWHNLNFGWFDDDMPVREAILKHAPSDGIYMIPNLPLPQEHKKTEVRKQWQSKVSKGPFVYMWIQRDGISFNMGISMLIQFLTQFCVSLLSVFLLCLTRISSYMGKVSFIAATIFTGTFLSLIPNWNWYGFPFVSTIVNIIDNTLSYFLAGLIMVKVLCSKETNC